MIDSESAVPVATRDLFTLVALMPFALRAFTTRSVLCFSKRLFFAVERVFTLGMLTVSTRFFESVSLAIAMFRELVPFVVIFATDFEKPIELFVVFFV